MQEQIPVEDKLNPPRQCGWCERPAVGEVVLEKARYRMDVKGGQKVRVITKAPLTAGVCRRHKNILDFQPQAEKPDTYRIQ